MSKLDTKRWGIKIVIVDGSESRYGWSCRFNNISSGGGIGCSNICESLEPGDSWSPTKEVYS